MSDNSADRSTNPQMSDDFARIYEEVGQRVTAPLSLAALDAVGGITVGSRVLDIAAGTGALSLPAADRGAVVTAIDIAPGMVKRTAAKLAAFPSCTAQVGDGEALTFADGFFDVTFSVLGVMTFSDWQKGLAEQLRVTRPGGKACVVTWGEPPADNPPGGGPFQVLFAALRTVFPDRPAPPWNPGFAALRSPDRLAGEMTSAGFTNVVVKETETVWDGPAGQAYLDEVKDLHGYIRPYVALDDEARAKVDEAIRRTTTKQSFEGRVRLPSPALIAIGRRP